MQRILEGLRGVIRWVLRPSYRRDEWRRQSEFQDFKRHTRTLWRDAAPLPAPTKTLLIVASGFTELLPVDVAFIQSLRMAGFEPVVLLWRSQNWVSKSYALWGVQRFVFWDDFLPPKNRSQHVPALNTFAEVLAFEVEGMRVGKWVASWVMRMLRVGSFDREDTEAWQTLMQNLPDGVRFAQASAAILSAVSPDTAIFIEKSYTPWGQLYDYCLRQGVDVIQWVGAHRNNVLMMKRYNPGNESQHPTSLSAASWERLKQMLWDQDKQEAVRDELFRDYKSGEWGSKMGAQIDKQIIGREELQSSLGLDPRKKTAVLFPHLFWDATFFYGRDLFRDYEDWFVQSVRAAIQNPALNWVIKLHPANVTKRHRDGYAGAYSEIVAIERHIGSLPDHIKLVPAESDISTYSYYSLMDFCLTVRGTVGLEAGVFGIPVLTAGTGRYDHLGFTIDSETSEEYLGRLAHLQDQPPLTPSQRELAQRFAYGILMMRPFPLKSVTLEFGKDLNATASSRFCVSTVRELVNGDDMRSFAAWVGSSTAEDWLADA